MRPPYENTALPKAENMITDFKERMHLYEVLCHVLGMWDCAHWIESKDRHWRLIFERFHEHEVSLMPLRTVAACDRVDDIRIEWPTPLTLRIVIDVAKVGMERSPAADPQYCEYRSVAPLKAMLDKADPRDMPDDWPRARRAIEALALLVANEEEHLPPRLFALQVHPTKGTFTLAASNMGATHYNLLRRISRDVALHDVMVMPRMRESLKMRFALQAVDQWPPLAPSAQPAESHKRAKLEQ